MHVYLSGGFKYFYFHSHLRKRSNLTNIFLDGLNHQLGILGSSIDPTYEKHTEHVSELPGNRHGQTLQGAG